LKDLVFSFFLVTNPGKFFETSVLPLLPFFEFISEDRVMVYPQKVPLIRIPYWRQVARFVRSLIERFKQSIALLPEGARQLIDAVLRLEPEFGELQYLLIVETCICGYLTKFMSTPNKPILGDAARVLMCLCPLPSALRRDIQPLLDDEALEIDSLLEAMRPTSEPLDDLKDAFEITGRLTLVTTRDLALLFKAVKRYQEFVPESKRKILGAPLAGIMEPKVITDSQFLQVRMMASEGRIEEISLKPTQPYDELADLLNVVDFAPMQYASPDELQHEIATMCSAFISPMLEQKLTSELLVDTGDVQAAVIDNHIALKKFSERLCSALFAAENEKDRLRGQLATLFQILARSNIVPALVELYPLDFIVREEDVFAPTEAYGRIIANVSARISCLGLTSENEHIVRRTFFLEFVDHIDMACEFQRMIKIDRIPARFAQFCQSNSQAVTELTVQRVKILSRAATTFQWIRCAHSISYNLDVALKALHPLTIFPRSAVALAIAMSGNSEVPAFVAFVSKYLKDDRIASVIMTDHEKRLIRTLQDAALTLGKDPGDRPLSLL
jgi:hypothetical protein